MEHSVFPEYALKEPGLQAGERERGRIEPVTKAHTHTHLVQLWSDILSDALGFAPKIIIPVTSTILW